jgi:hypothetical protein
VFSSLRCGGSRSITLPRYAIDDFRALSRLRGGPYSPLSFDKLVRWFRESQITLRADDFLNNHATLVAQRCGLHSQRTDGGAIFVEQPADFLQPRSAKISAP